MPTFEDTLRMEIRKAAEDRRNFDTQWEIRRRKILSTLERAAVVISSEIGESKASINNGGVALKVNGFEIRFSPDRVKLQIACSSNIGHDLLERFDLESLTDNMVEVKVRQFACNAERNDKPLVYEVTW